MRFALLIMCFSIFGFSFGEKAVVQEEKSTFVPYEIYVKNDREKAVLEEDSCLTGAYIRDENIYSDVNKFEEKTGVSNDIYIVDLKVGENLPKSEIIGYYAKGKIPMLTIETGFGSSQINTIAKSCGDLDIPIFVEINSENIYIYECFAEIFRDKAPKTVLVYGISSDCAKPNFPNEDLVDWVGINAYEKISQGYIVTEYENVLRLCEYYKNKPVMLNLKVPNYSIEKCNYVYEDAGNEIGRLFAIALDYNNVGAVNYISSIKKDDNIVVENSRITESDVLIEAYREGVSFKEAGRYWCKTPFVAYVSENKIFVGKSTAEVLGLDCKYVNSGVCEIKANGVSREERKVFVG